jgi:hypothetical protein
VAGARPAAVAPPPGRRSRDEKGAAQSGAPSAAADRHGGGKTADMCANRGRRSTFSRQIEIVDAVAVAVRSARQELDHMERRRLLANMEIIRRLVDAHVIG